MMRARPAAPVFADGPPLTEAHLQWHVANFFPGDAIVAVVPFRHHPTTPWHDHDFFELAVIESGRGIHESDDGVLPLRAGVAMLLPPGAGHEYRGCEDMRVYNCLFRAELIDAELMWARRDRLLGPLFEPARASAPGSGSTFVELTEPAVRKLVQTLEPIRAGEATSRPAQLARLLLALEIFAEAARPARGVEAQESSPLVADAMELLARDLAHPWSLDELSSRMFVGRFHLARTFARCVGQPPMHYLARLRAERAAALLASTDLPVAVIGSEVGWPDPAYFSRRFRAAFGVSPRDYRRHRSNARRDGSTGVKDVQEHGNRRQVAV